MTKSSPSIWHLLNNVKLTAKILSIFVAFLENMNFSTTYEKLRAYCPNIYILCCRAADRIDGNNKLWQVMWSRYEISTDNEFRPPNGMSAAMRVRDKKKMSALRQLGQRPLDSLLLSSKFVLDQELVITFFERQKRRR